MEILKKMVKRNHRVQNSSYRCMIVGLCKNKKVDIAIQVLEIMISNRCQPDEDVYSAIIKGVSAAGMTEEATELQQKLIELKVFREETTGIEQINSKF